jgi:hypothetical protein
LYAMVVDKQVFLMHSLLDNHGLLEV